MTYKKNIYFAQTLIHSSLILANCSTEEKPSWLRIIRRFRVHWMYIVLRCQNWSGWRVFSQEIPVLLTGRVWDQAFLFIHYLSLLFCPCRVWLFVTPPRLQHVRLLCPALSPRVCWNSCPLNEWSHPTISSFAAPLWDPLGSEYF